MEVTDPPAAELNAEAAETGVTDAGQAKGRGAKPAPIDTPQQLAKKTKKARQDSERPAQRQRLREKSVKSPRRS